MNESEKFFIKVRNLIDDLKSVCSNYGLGNDGNEFKIITQVFLYKFLHDKFVKEIKLIEKKLDHTNWEEKLANLSEDQFEIITMQLNESTALLKPNQLIKSLFAKQNEANFADIFDKTLMEIALQNNDIFSVITGGGEKIALFENLSKYVSDNRDDFCKAIINKLVGFSFEDIFLEGFDFFATIFEYLIKDYNIDSGGTYAEYFTPHSVSKIISRCLVSDELRGSINNVTCYDPSAGSGTLLMNLAYQIGQDNCTIYSQDISQKSSNLLRLNLVLNNLVHSIHNIIQGNTLTEPAHRSKDGSLDKFDYIVANPPFKLDFSEFRNDLDRRENDSRFFAGIPKIPQKKKESMAIYLVFLQHIIFSLKKDGKAAVVVPTGFISAQSGIPMKIRKKLVEEKMLSGVISMPSNIFAKTGTNVSVLFIDKSFNENIVLIDASNLGEEVKDGKNQRIILKNEEIEKIIKSFISKKLVEDFSIPVSYEEIREKNYSLSPGHYFDIKIEYSEITKDEFDQKIENYNQELRNLFLKSGEIQKEIEDNLKNLSYE